jgi:hypothetical protein
MWKFTSSFFDFAKLSPLSAADGLAMRRHRLFLARRSAASWSRILMTSSPLSSAL